MRIFRSETKYDFLGQMNLFGGISAVVVFISVLLIAVMGLNFGIDFAGGYEIQVKFPETVSETQIRAQIDPLGIGDARIQRFGPADDNEFLILVREHGTIVEEEKIALKLDFENLAGGADFLNNWAIAQSGENLIAGFENPVEESKVRALVEKHNLQIKKITRGERADKPEYNVELISLADQIQSALMTGMKIPKGVELVKRIEFVGPQVGQDLQMQGIMAVLYALVFILLYIAVRFDLFFSPGAIVALIHDVAILMGIFSLFQLEFNLPIIAAILTLVGYSLNDTIVVYDRIRENALRLRGRDLRSLVNTSINQTLSRTILTSGTTLLVVATLIVFGGSIIRDFAIALTVGVVVGTYSSVFIASPVYIYMRERFQETNTKGNRTSVSKASA